jgi:O-antigen/teichoic acid export membrane protein
MTGDVSERRAIARNAATSYAARGLLMLSVLLVTPYLFRKLGTAGFGTWSVMVTLTTVFSLLEIGFSDGIVRLVASERARGDREAVRRTIATGTTIMAAFGVLALAAAVATGLFGSGLAAEGESRAFTLGMLVLGAAMLARFPCVAWGAALKGYQRYDLWNVSFMATVVLTAVGAVAAIESGAGILGLAAAHGVALVLGALLWVVLLAVTDRGAVARPALGDRSTRRRIAGFSSLTLAAETFVQIGQRLDVAIIAAIRGATSAAPYAAALKLQSGVQGATLPFVDLLMPMASDLWARGEREAVIRRLTLATRIAAQVTLPLAFAIALFSTDVVAVWLGPSAPPVTATIVVVLMAVQVLGLTAAPARKILIGVGRARLVALLSLIEGVGSVALTILLVAAYGALGAAVATLIAVGLIAPLKLPFACRTLGFPTGPFLRDSLGRAALSVLPAAVTMTAVWAWLDPGGARLAAGVGAGLAAWIAVSAGQLARGRPTVRLSLVRSPT